MKKILLMTAVLVLAGCSKRAATPAADTSAMAPAMSDTGVAGKLRPGDLVFFDGEDYGTLRLGARLNAPSPRPDARPDRGPDQGTPRARRPVRRLPHRRATRLRCTLRRPTA